MVALYHYCSDPVSESYTFRKAARAVKDAVPLEDYLSDQGVELKRGRACCPIHGGNNPTSFEVTAERGTFHCFSCKASGDVVDACEYLEKHAESWTAVVSLASRYGVDIPGRNEAWSRRQAEKRQDRDKLIVVLARTYQRRLFRAFFTEYMQSVDPEERAGEAKEVWNDLWPVAHTMAVRRMEK